MRAWEEEIEGQRRVKSRSALTGRSGPRRVKLYVASLGGVLVLSLVACGGTSLSSPSSGSKKCSYKVGVLEPLSGAAAPLGQPVVEGIQFAEQDINQHGGVNGCQLEIDSQDYESKADIAVTRVQKLIDDGVYGIIGPNQGDATLAIAPIVQKNSVPVCAFNNTISITHIGNPYIFRCQADDTDQTKAAILFLKQKLQAKKIAILHTDDAYGTDAATALEEVAKSGTTAVTITSDQKFAYQATDTTVQWSRAKADNPDAYILWGSGTSQSVALRNARQVGITAPIIGGQGLATLPTIQAAGAAAEGVYVINLIDPSKTTPAQKTINKLLQQKEGASYQPSVYNYIGWDALHLYAAALKNNSKDAKAGLESIKSLTLAAGTYHFSASSHNGLGLDSITINQVKDGRFVGVQTGIKG